MPDEPQVTPLAEEPPADPFGQRDQRYDGEADPALIIKARNAQRQYDQAGIPWPPDPESEEPPAATPPKLTAIDPNVAEVGGSDLIVNLHGSGFTPNSVIVFNGGEEATTMEADTRLTTIVKPSLVGQAIAVPVFVRTGTHETASFDFSFTESVPEPEPEPEGLRKAEPVTDGIPVEPEELDPEADEADEMDEADDDVDRELPLGPYSIRAIDNHDSGLAIMLNSPEDGLLDVRVGDGVLVEATGNTNVNGNYVVVIQDGTTVVVEGFVNLSEPIENKGRLTVVE